MALFNTDSRLLGSKLEGTSGTVEPVLEYNVRAREADLSQLEVEYSDNSKIMDGTHTHVTATPGMARMSIDSTIQLAKGEFLWDGAAFASKIPYGKFLRSSGLKMIEFDPTDENTDDGKIVFVPSSSDDCTTLSASILDITSCGSGGKTGVEYKGKGLMSTLVIEADKPGAPISLKFSSKGPVSDVLEILTANVPTFDDDGALQTASEKFINTDIKVTKMNNDGSDAGNAPVAFCSNSFKLDTGVTLGEVLCQADRFGLLQSLITAREPKFNINPMLEKLSDYNFWRALNSEDVYKIETIVYSDAGKTDEVLKVEIPRAQMISANGTDDSGLRRLEQEFRILKNIQAVAPFVPENDFIITIGAKTVIL